METNNKFKAGDKVVRTTNFEVYDDDGFMQKGKEYIVVSCSDQDLVVQGRLMIYDTRLFELVERKFKNMKFRVNSPEHSKEIQEALFEMGYKWSGEENYLSVNANFIYAYGDGALKWNLHETDFSKNLNHEYTIETTKSYKLIPVETPKETITIDGNTYDKEAVLKRLAELETVE